MISILVLSIIVVLIAALLLYRSEKTLNYQIEELDKKYKFQTSAINDLDKAQLRYQQLSKKIEGELDFWKKRRTMLPKVPKNTRKEKIRGKRRKGRK
jgi:predicted Holliday junction resolvase-like endonuclease